MDKTALLDLIQFLPDNLMVLPLEMTEIVDAPTDWSRVPSAIGAFDSAVYQRKVRTTAVIRLCFTTDECADFKRDAAGNEQWANFRKAVEGKS